MKIFILLLLNSLAFGKDLEKMTLEVISDTEDKNQAIYQVVEQVSKDFVKEFIGEKRYEENIARIEKEIISNKNRYILFAKALSVTSQEDGKYSIKILVGVSKKNLKNLLLEYNLFYSSDGAHCVLPAVSLVFKDEEKETHYWWKKKSNKKTSDTVKNLYQVFYNYLSKDLIKIGFYAENPLLARFSLSVPSSVFPKRTTIGQFKKLSEFLNCDIIMSGQLSIERDFSKDIYVGDMKIKIFNITTKQNLFEFNQKFSFITASLKEEFRNHLPQFFETLKYQLSFYKDKGSLDLNRLTLSIQGPIDFYEKERLQKLLIKRISAIKDLKKSRITSRQVIYNLESSAQIPSLVKSIRSSRISQFKLQITGYNRKRLDIYATRK